VTSAARTIVMIAGESSGDIYGAKVMEMIAARAPQITCYGIGGKKMKDKGVRLLASSDELAVVGVIEVLAKVGKIWKAWRRIRHLIEDQRPNLAVLIDYPGFNLRLAKLFQAHAVPVLYYVSPQIWAWRPGRIKKIAKRVSKMAVILPFEEPLYKKAGVDAEFVGHPLLDILDMGLTRAEARRRLGVSRDALLIGLLPGSRGHEVKGLLPPLVGAARLLQRDFPSSRFIIPLAPTIRREDVQELIERHAHGALPIEIVEGRTFEVMRAADCLLVVSGTATLEGAIAGAPMVIIYRLSPITYLLGRMLVRVRCIGLANIVVGKKVVPELLQGDVSPQRIAHEAKVILQNASKQKAIKDEFRRVRHKLGGRGASQRVARLALHMMGVR
jgi:lipid-A-disaccharide synthase